MADLGKDERGFANRISRDIREFIHSENSDNCFHTYIDHVSEADRVITFTVYFVEGLYASGHFQFAASIPTNFPFSSPIIVALQPIYHPNINLLTREVYVPIDWSPVLTLCSYVLALKVFIDKCFQRYENFLADLILMFRLVYCTLLYCIVL